MSRPGPTAFVGRVLASRSRSRRTGPLSTSGRSIALEAGSTERRTLFICARVGDYAPVTKCQSCSAQRTIRTRAGVGRAVCANSGDLYGEAILEVASCRAACNGDTNPLVIAQDLDPE